MAEHQSLSPEELAKQRYEEHFQKARKGVLQFMQESGGKLPLGQMHDYSLRKFLIQHQGFSQMMEDLVNEGLVEFDHGTFMATITETGKKFAHE